MTILHGLAPVHGPGAKVLILGSFPGARSLATRRYYAFGHNRFWPVMARICELSAEAPYAERLRSLRAHGIALWDVLASCERRGSMDADIVRGSELPNDFGDLMRRHGELRRVRFNGQTAARLFSRLVIPHEHWDDTGLDFAALPSTSPAHAAMGIDRLAATWRASLGVS